MQIKIYHSWENQQNISKIILWKTKILSELLICKIKHVCFCVFLPVFPAQTPPYSSACLKFTRNPDILKWEYFADLKAQKLKSLGVSVLGSRAYFVYCKVTEKFVSFVVAQVYISKYSANVGKKQDLLLGNMFKGSVICRSESGSCRKAGSFDLFLASSKGGWTEHAFKNETGLAYWKHQPQSLLLSHTVLSSGDLEY